MDTYKAALEAELKRFNEEDDDLLLKLFRQACANPSLPSKDPFNAFSQVINATQPAIQMNETNAMKGGMQAYLYDLLCRLTPPEELAKELANNKALYLHRVHVRKAREMNEFARQKGMTKELVQAKKVEVGWGKDEEDEMERQAAYDRQLEEMKRQAAEKANKSK